MRRLTPFHLAIPVQDIAAARAFYGALLGGPEGRSADRSSDRMCDAARQCRKASDAM